jgi:quinol monooxygenase YgiN
MIEPRDDRAGCVKRDKSRRGVKCTVAIRRRDFLAVGATAITALGAGASAFAARGDEMYGLIGKMTAVPGKRDELVAILLDAASGMPGCLSYIVARDADDANAIWITEAWDSQASHDASLSIPSVKARSRKAGRSSPASAIVM